MPSTSAAAGELGKMRRLLELPPRCFRYEALKRVADEYSTKDMRSEWSEVRMGWQLFSGFRALLVDDDLCNGSTSYLGWNMSLFVLMELFMLPIGVVRAPRLMKVDYVSIKGVVMNCIEVPRLSVTINKPAF